MNALLDSRRRFRHDGLVIGIGAVLVVPWIMVWFARYPSKRFLLVACAVLALVAVLYACYNRLRTARVRELPLILSLIVLGALFITCFTPGTVPDEGSHFWSSYGLANMFLGQPVDTAARTLAARSCDVALKFDDTLQLTANAYAKVGMHFSWLDAGSEIVSFGAPKVSLDYAANVVWFKAPSALAIVAARLLGLGAYPLFYLGRIVNYLVFAALAYVAVRITPVGKAGFRAVILLPMTLHVAASYSYDAEVIGCSLLACAVAIRLIYAPDRCSKRELVALPVVLVLLAPCKLVYSLLSLMVLAVPAAHFPSKRAAWGYRVAVLALTALSVLAVRASALFAVTGVEPSTGTLDVRGDEWGTFYALTDLICDPVGALMLLSKTMVDQGSFYLVTLLGGSLTWFQQNLEAPAYLVLAMFIILAVSWVRPASEKQSPLRHRALFAVIVALGFFAVLLSMCVGWTFTTEDVIQGVQGRYFIPFLPLVGWSFVRGGNLVAQRSPARATLVAMVLVNVLNLMRIVAIGATTFQ